AILPLFLPFPPPPISTLFPYTTLFRSLLLIHVVRLADLGEHHAREIRSVRAFVLLSESFDEQAELIASEAADNGFARQYARETLAQHLECPIACGMTEGVVDLLETVHIEIQHHDAPLCAARPCDRLLQHVLELHAIGHLRERIVACQVADPA